MKHKNDAYDILTISRLLSRKNRLDQLTFSEDFPLKEVSAYGRTIKMDNKFTAKDILEKDFKIGMRGYNQDEVDHFLDDIIQDYEAFAKKIDQLTNENKRLRAELEDAPRKQATPAPGTTNFDILRRLSHLENHVFGNKLNNE